MEQKLFKMCEALTNKLHEYRVAHPNHDTDSLVEESRKLLNAYQQYNSQNN